MGLVYFNNDSVKENTLKAVKYFIHAAELGNTDAQYLLGLIYENGLDGVEIDAKAAIHWLGQGT